MPSADKLVGPLVDLEVTDDHTATTVSWTKVAYLADSIELSPNAEIADQNDFEARVLDKSAVSEAWEQTFSKNVTVVEAGLQALGLLDDNYRMQGSVDTRHMTATAPAIRFSAYQTEEDMANDSPGWQLGCEDYVIARGDTEINPDDYSLGEYTLHYRRQPVRLDLGGSLGAP